MFVAIDFETTSLRTDRRATEIGLVVMDANLTVIHRFASLVNPGISADPMALAVSGISQADIDAAPSFSALWPEIGPCIEGRIAIAHFSSFDERVLANELAHLGGRQSVPAFMCTMKLARQVLGSTVPNHKLGTVAAHLGVRLDNAHEALADAEATAEVFARLLGLDSRLKQSVQRAADRQRPAPIPNVMPSKAAGRR